MEGYIEDASLPTTGLLVMRKKNTLISLNDASIPDGTSHTLMVGEKLLAISQ